MAIESFEQLEVWQEAHQLVLQVYSFTAILPKDERFGLTSQMRRAAISVPANIAEGFKREGSRDKVRFYNTSHASLEELRYYFILCCDLSYGVANEDVNLRMQRIGKMLNGLTRSIRERVD